MKRFTFGPSRRTARMLLLAVTASLAGLHSSLAVIAIPRDFPLELTNGEQAEGNSHLIKLVSMYRNDVVLLTNPEEAFSKEIREAKGTPELREKLQKLATSDGTKLTPDSLGAAAAALARQNPAEAPLIMASAMEILAENPKKISVEERYAVARRLISGIPNDLKERPALIASVVGIGARGLKLIASTDLVRQLRDFTINNGPTGQAGSGNSGLNGPQASLALSLDEALVTAGILSPYVATPDFLVRASNFPSDQLAETYFSGDQGVIDQGAVFSPGGPGSAGGAGSTGNQINPEPPPAS